MKRLFFVLISVLVCSVSFGQRYYNKTESDIRYPKISDGFQLTDTFPRRSEVEANLLLKADKTFTDQIEFIVGYSGGATLKNGDSILTDTRWIGKDMVIYKNGLRIYKNLTATNGKLGFRFNSTTGQIVFRPVLSTNDVIIVDSKATNFTQSFLPQNLFKYSEVLTNAAWYKDGLTSVTDNAALDLSGNMTLDLCDITGGGAVYAVYYNGGASIVVKASTSYTIAFDCKLGTTPSVSYAIRDESNSAWIVASYNYTADCNTSTVTRVTRTFTTPVGCIKLGFYPIYGIATYGTVYLGRFQIAENATAPYVTTTTSIAD